MERRRRALERDPVVCWCAGEEALDPLLVEIQLERFAATTQSREDTGKLLEDDSQIRLDVDGPTVLTEASDLERDTLSPRQRTTLCGEDVNELVVSAQQTIARHFEIRRPKPIHRRIADRPCSCGAYARRHVDAKGVLTAFCTTA